MCRPIAWNLRAGPKRGVSSSRPRSKSDGGMRLRAHPSSKVETDPWDPHATTVPHTKEDFKKYNAARRLSGACSSGSNNGGVSSTSPRGQGASIHRAGDRDIPQSVSQPKAHQLHMDFEMFDDNPPTKAQIKFFQSIFLAIIQQAKPFTEVRCLQKCHQQSVVVRIQQCRYQDRYPSRGSTNTIRDPPLHQLKCHHSIHQPLTWKDHLRANFIAMHQKLEKKRTIKNAVISFGKTAKQRREEVVKHSHPKQATGQFLRDGKKGFHKDVRE
ncbi:unnamed protein product [Caenorhabditis nigoni]